MGTGIALAADFFGLLSAGSAAAAFLGVGDVSSLAALFFRRTRTFFSSGSLAIIKKPQIFNSSL
jgi:hypothetical protein